MHLRDDYMKKLLSLICCVLLFCTVAFAEENYSGYIVKLKENCVLPLASLYSDGEITPLDNEQTAELLSDEYENIGVIYSPEGLIKAEDEETLQELIDMGIVEYAEPDLICELYGYAPEQNPLYANQWAHEAINSEYAWNMGVYGQEVRVGVIDSGVSPHPDLAACLLPGGDFEGLTERGDTPGTDTRDNVWHGTFVAGIIAAQCNDIGVVGLAHNVKIVPLKVCDSATFTLSYVIPAIYAAVDVYDCDVINMSLGSSTVATGGVRYVNGRYESGTIPSSASVAGAVNYATMKGVIVVAASGNDGERQTKTTDASGNVIEKRHLSIPAIMNNVVSVGNVKKVGTGDSISYAIDSSSTYNEYVHVSAPGTSVYSTYCRNSSSSYTTATGTSFATPYVAAAAAIMKCIDPSINYSTFNNLVTKTANSSYITDAQGEIYWGKGMLDIEAMIKYYLRKEGSFISRPSVNSLTGECTVGINNPGEIPNEYMLVMSGGTQDEPEIRIVSSVLLPGESKTVSLTRYGLDENADTQMSVLVRGDSDGDGNVDATDLEMLADSLSGKNIMNPIERFRANAYVPENSSETDSDLDIKDLIKLAQKIK